MEPVFHDIKNRNHRIYDGILDTQHQEFMRQVFNGVPAYPAILNVWGSLKEYQRYINEKIPFDESE